MPDKLNTLKDTIHIVYIPIEGRVESIARVVTQIRLIKPEFKEVYIILQEELIEKIAKTLPKDALIYFWVHLDSYNKPDASGLPHNLIIERQLKKKYLSTLGKVFFITTGSEQDLTGEPIGPNIPGIKIKRDDQEHFVYSINVFDDFDLLPPASTVKSLFQPQIYQKESLPKKVIKKANNVNFTKGIYDFKVKTLITALGKGTIDYILGETIGDDYKKYHLDIINPGYSGAFVLKVIANEGDITDYFVLKISKNKTELKKELEAGRKNSLRQLGDKFIGAFADYSNEDVLGWACNVYPLSFGETLRKKLREEFLNNNSIPSIYLEVTLDTLQLFEKKYAPRFTKEMHPFPAANQQIDLGGSSGDYEGLIPSASHIKKIVANLFNIKNKFQYLNDSVVKDIFLDVNWDPFIDFLKNIESSELRYKFKRIHQLIQIITPTSITHGDLHTANIMIDKDGLAVIIDFANMPEQAIKHAFLDLGKLSSDLEISIVPEAIILANSARLKDWVAYHRKWLYNNLSFQEKDKNDPFTNLYQAQDYILRKGILEKNIYQNKGMTDLMIRRQFQMVRLHYFLKALSYDNEVREKQFFFIRASMDIFEFLINTNDLEES